MMLKEQRLSQKHTLKKKLILLKKKNVKRSCYMKEQARELGKEKKRNAGKIQKQVMNFRCCCFPAGSKLWELYGTGSWFLSSQNMKNLEWVGPQI